MLRGQSEWWTIMHVILNLMFTLPFIGFVLGLFMVGVFLTAPVSAELFRTNLWYGLSQAAVFLSGLALVILLIGVEARASAKYTRLAPKFGVSFGLFLVCFVMGFAGPFTVLARFAAEGVS